MLYLSEQFVFIAWSEPFVLVSKTSFVIENKYLGQTVEVARQQVFEGSGTIPKNRKRIVVLFGPFLHLREAFGKIDGNGEQVERLFLLPIRVSLGVSGQFNFAGLAGGEPKSQHRRFAALFEHFFAVGLLSVGRGEIYVERESRMGAL